MPKITQPKERILTPEELRKEKIAKAIESYFETKNLDCLMEFFNEEESHLMADALEGKYGIEIPVTKVIKYADSKALQLHYVFLAIASGYSDRMTRLFAKPFSREQMEMVRRAISEGLSEELVVSLAEISYPVSLMEKIIVRETTRMKFLKQLLEKHHMKDYSKAYELRDFLSQCDRNINADSYVKDNSFDKYIDVLITEYSKHYDYIDALLYTYDSTPYVSMENVYVSGYRMKGNASHTYKAVTICIRTRCGTKPSKIKWNELEFIIKTMLANNNEASKYPYEDLELLRMNLNSVGSEITAIYKIKE